MTVQVIYSNHESLLETFSVAAKYFGCRVSDIQTKNSEADAVPDYHIVLDDQFCDEPLLNGSEDMILAKDFFGPLDDGTLDAKTLEQKYKTQHPTVRRQSWVTEVIHDKTYQGYWEWVVAQLKEQA